MHKSVSSCVLDGTVAIPSSKSDGQRAVLCAGLGTGKSIISNLGNSDDELRMLENIQQLGARVQKLSAGKFEIEGFDSLPGFVELNCGESGLGLRLTTSVLAAFDGRKQISGHGSILQREHSFFDKVLPEMGVGFSSNGGKLPFEICGKLKGGKSTVDGSQSSQFISGLLMALPLLEEDTVLAVTNLNSKPYVQMTLDTLSAFGIEVEHKNLEEFTIQGEQAYRSTEYVVESDWSSASYWLAAAAIGHEVKLTGLNLKSAQADRKMIEALETAGCIISVENGVLSLDHSGLKSFEFDATHCPDLFPALVCVAAFCDGISILHGVSRLENKESNRGLVLQKEFGKLGLRIDLDGDEMRIHGGAELNGGMVDSNNDHRIAMCLAIAGTRIDDEVNISGAEAVSKSYPGFWNDLTALMKSDH